MPFFTVSTKYGAVAAATVTPIAILAGIYLALAYLKRPWKDKNEKDDAVFRRSVSLAAVHGGQLALQRLIDYHHARADATSLQAARIKLQDQLTKIKDQELVDFKKLQRNVSRMEMSGEEAAAIAILKNELKKYRKEGKPHEAYEIEMLLVEMYIYKGEFQKALDCECLKHEEISDARRSLFKAMLHIMLQHPKKEALKCWEEFKDVYSHFLCPPTEKDSLNYKVTNDFNMFEKVVKVLKDDIDKALLARKIGR